MNTHFKEERLKAYKAAGLTWKVCLMSSARFSASTFQISGWREFSTKTRGFWWCSMDWIGFRCSSTLWGKEITEQKDSYEHNLIKQEMHCQVITSEVIHNSYTMQMSKLWFPPVHLCLTRKDQEKQIDYPAVNAGLLCCRLFSFIRLSGCLRTPFADKPKKTTRSDLPKSHLLSSDMEPQRDLNFHTVESLLTKEKTSKWWVSVTISKACSYVFGSQNTIKSDFHSLLVRWWEQTCMICFSVAGVKIYLDHCHQIK